MNLICFGIICITLLAIPIATMIAERYDPTKREIKKMADADRVRQSAQLPNRRLQYTWTQKNPVRRQPHGACLGGHRTNDTRMIARIGGSVK